MANFVTFKDKLGHTSLFASVYAYTDASLPCEIKALEGRCQGEVLASKMHLEGEGQSGMDEKVK